MPPAVVALVVAACVPLAVSHGSMSFPRPRNALDDALEPWKSWSYPRDPIHFSSDGKSSAGACPIPAKAGGVPNTLRSNGQACYWFSNGCTIGCDSCDGSADHCGHGSAGTPMPSFVYTGSTPIDPWTPQPGTMVLDPKKPRPVARSNCANRHTNATICDPRLRVRSPARVG